MVNSTILDVGFYLKRIKRNLDSSKNFNFKENMNYATSLHYFIDNFINKRAREIHYTKFYYLKKIIGYIESFIQLCKQEDKQKLSEVFSMIINEFNSYSSFGSVYLIRHPEKSREQGRSLTIMGVQQTKQVAELIRDEILLTPKPVKINIYTSEVKRTQIFGEVIKYINQAKEIGKENLQITQQPDERLYMGPLSDNVALFVNQNVEKYGTEGEVKSFFGWLRREDVWMNEINNKGIGDPIKTRNDVENFVRFAIKKASDQNYYTIVIGISHSWILDSWLYSYTGIPAIISTAEYAKIEFNELYYKGRWVNLFSKQENSYRL